MNWPIGISCDALAFGIFRGHLCNCIALTANDGILHSLKGRIEKKGIQTFQEKYPYMLENAFILNKNSDSYAEVPNGHSHQDRYLGGDLFVRLPDFREYKKINAQTIREYYHHFHGIDITNKETGNTIKDLFESNQLQLSKNSYN